LTAIEIPEPTIEMATKILEEEAVTIENRLGVYITHPAIEASVELAKQYITDKVLPESALTLLDEAASTSAQAKRFWVRKDDVETVVEHHTSIPVHQATAEETDRLLNIESELHQRIVGQDEAVNILATALRRLRAGLRNPNKPIATFMFVGPTGVGKTETAKAVAASFFQTNEPMIRLDMSEYQDANASYRLIGTPGSEEGGMLTQAVREHPYSLVLLDELEKASPDVLNLFLQILDDARVTENSGRTVSFNNCLIIATSNAGSEQIVELVKQNLGSDTLREEVLKVLRQFFKPEFLNRFDALVPFQALTPDQAVEITAQMLEETRGRMRDQGYEVTFAPELITFVAQAGFDQIYGARPLRRYIQDHVEGMLATKILDKTLQQGEPLQVTADMLQ
jgi:ATP-dependent Clp protease ATP-binding subunit ClpA